MRLNGKFFVICRPEQKGQEKCQFHRSCRIHHKRVSPWLRGGLGRIRRNSDRWNDCVAVHSYFRLFKAHHPGRDKRSAPQVPSLNPNFFFFYFLIAFNRKTMSARCKWCWASHSPAGRHHLKEIQSESCFTVEKDSEAARRTSLNLDDTRQGRGCKKEGKSRERRLIITPLLRVRRGMWQQSVQCGARSFFQLLDTPTSSSAMEKEER